MISIILTLFSLFLSTQSELNNYEILASPPNYFDNEYHILSKNSANEKISSFDEKNACMMEIKDRKIIFYIQNYKSLVRSGGFHIELPGHPNSIKLITCFKYSAYSYIIYKNIEKNETVIIRGNNAKTFKGLKFDKIMFDSIEKKLYLLHYNQLYNIEIGYLENIWKNSSWSQYGVIKMNFVASIKSGTTDLFIINNYIFYIFESKIYKFKIYSQNEEEFVTDTNSLKFNYLLFKAENKINIGGNTQFWLTMLYIIDVLIILACIYIFKQPRFLKSKRFEGHPLTVLISNDDHDDKDRVYHA